MRYQRTLLATGVALVAGAATTVALADGGAPEAPTDARSAIVAVSEPLPANLHEVAIDTGGIDPTTTLAKGYRLPVRDATIWVVRDDAGRLCLVDGSGASCGPDNGGAGGMLSVNQPPHHPEFVRAAVAAHEAGLTGEERLEFVRNATQHLPPVSGPATFLGYSDPSRGAEVAKLIDADGSTIAQTELQHGLYEFRVADVATADPREIRLEGDALAAPITLGPFPGDRL